MKILITGVAGFIGFSTANSLLKNNKNTVLGIDNFDNYYSTKYKRLRVNFLKKKKNFYFKKLDITKKNKLYDLFSKKNFDLVIHFAAQAGVRYSLINPKKYIAVNKNGFKFLLDAIIKNKIPKRIIYASSSSVYGNSQNFPTKEIQKLKPQNIYAKTKISNEQLAIKYKKKYNLNICGLRFFTVYGEWGRPDMFLFKLLKAYKNNKSFYLNNYGNHLRDFTYIKDACKILKKLIYSKFKHRHLILNICSNKPLKLTNIIKMIDNLTLNKPKIKKISMHKADIYKTHGDNSLVKKITGVKKFTDTSIGLKNTIEWIIKNKDTINL